MDIGDIIYVILMVGAIIASIIKKKLDSDKKTDAPKRKVPDMMQEMFPDLKELINQEDEIEDGLTEPTSVEEPEQPKESKVPYFTYDNLDANKKYSILHHYEMDESDVDDNSLEKQHEIINDDFDLRKAVIYSEIINRPEHCKF